MARRSTSEHQDAVSRRLALLSAELAAERPADPEEWGDGWSAGHREVRPNAAYLPEPPRDRPADADPVWVPVPGRHAARRRMSPAALVPEPLRGRVRVGPAQLTVVAVTVAVGLAVTCWWVLRASPATSDAPPVAPAPAALTTLSASPSPVAAGATEASVPTVSGTGSVTVDVTGKVRRPGIVVLDAGARVVDALEAAGGARSGVDLSSLNLARLLVDGEQVVVGVPAPTGVAAGAVPSVGTTGGPLVNLNTATTTELEALPEVGPVTAQAIVTWRAEHGGFTAVDELLEVDGIGDATLSQIAPYVTV